MLGERVKGSDQEKDPFLLRQGGGEDTERNVEIEGVHIDDLDLYSQVQLRSYTVIEGIEEERKVMEGL